METEYGNKVIVCQTTFLPWVPPFLSYELWKLKIELPNLPIQMPPKFPFEPQLLLSYPTSIYICEVTIAPRTYSDNIDKFLKSEKSGRKKVLKNCTLKLKTKKLF